MSFTPLKANGPSSWLHGFSTEPKKNPGLTRGIDRVPPLLQGEGMLPGPSKKGVFLQVGTKKSIEMTM